jgi:hypothetical protein
MYSTLCYVIPIKFKEDWMGAIFEAAAEVSGPGGIGGTTPPCTGRTSGAPTVDMPVCCKAWMKSEADICFMGLSGVSFMQ